MALFTDPTKPKRSKPKPKPAKVANERQRAADRMRKKREGDRVVVVEVSAKSIARRQRHERDLFRWLRFYFPNVFTAPFTKQQKEMATAILSAAQHGGDQAIAAPRGEGKTTICECVVIFCVLTGALSFPVIFSATGPDAERILRNIKSRLDGTESPRLLEDYGEVCGPAAALEGLPNRANGQTAAGRIGDHTFPATRTRIRWSGREITLPTIKAPGSRATGAIIMTRGLDAAVRGLRVGARRPDLAVIDDPETREIAESDERPGKLARKIDADVAGLAGQQKRLSRVMLTTIMNRKCLSYRYTDPKRQPSWKGRRLRLLVKPPDRDDLWQEYIELRQTGQADGDDFGRAAHAFYKKNRRKMDRGAVVGNKHRYSRDTLPDGSPMQISALQFCFDTIADMGRDAFDSEFQNDPPEEAGPIESGISANRIQRQLSGFDRRIVPPGCAIVTQGIDVRKMALHFVVRAWQPGAIGFTIDYGVHEVRGTVRGSDDGVEVALVRALEERRQDLAENPYTTIDGEIVDIKTTLVDAGWQTDAIYHFCRSAGRGWRPAMGFGRSNGCVQAAFNMPSKDNERRRSGQQWFLSYRNKQKVWLVCCNADYWKAWEHSRWLTDPGRPGCMQNFGTPGDGDRMNDDEKRHFSYAKHLTAEVEVEEVVKGILTRRFKSKSDTNHYLDASYLADVAASMNGIKLLTKTTKKPKQKIKMSERIAARRNR